MIAAAAALARRLSKVFLLIWSLPAALLMLWTYAVLNNGGPIRRHPVFIDWLKIELALAATFFGAAWLVRRLAPAGSG
jgi:hypothetical protein